MRTPVLPLVLSLLVLACDGEPSDTHTAPACDGESSSSGSESGESSTGSSTDTGGETSTGTEPAAECLVPPNDGTESVCESIAAVADAIDCEGMPEPATCWAIVGVFYSDSTLTPSLARAWASCEGACLEENAKCEAIARVPNLCPEPGYESCRVWLESVVTVLDETAIRTCEALAD